MFFGCNRKERTADELTFTTIGDSQLVVVTSEIKMIKSSRTYDKHSGNLIFWPNLPVKMF